MTKKQCEAGEDTYVNQKEQFEWVTTKHKAGHIHVLQDSPLDLSDYDVVQGIPKQATVKGGPGEYAYEFTYPKGKTNPKIIIS